MAKTKSSLYASLNYSLILMKDIQKIDKLLVNWSFSKRPAGGASSVRLRAFFVARKSRREFNDAFVALLE